MHDLKEESDHSPEAVEMEKLLTSLLRTLFQPRLGDPLTDLTQAQIRMMRALEHGPESASVVGENLCLTVSAVTQVANRLEALGLIERTEAAADRRVKPLALTAHGGGLLQHRNEMRIKRVEAALSRLEQKDHILIRDALTKLRDAWQIEQSNAGKKPYDSSTAEQPSSTEELTSIARRLADPHRVP